MIKQLSEMDTDELINYAKSQLDYLNTLESELLKRLEIAMDILLHDSQQQSNH